MVAWRRVVKVKEVKRGQIVDKSEARTDSQCVLCS